jgi:hypothetical protein
MGLRFGKGSLVGAALAAVVMTGTLGGVAQAQVDTDPRTCQDDFDNWADAYESFQNGNTSLDDDNDGIPCEALWREAGSPAVGGGNNDTTDETSTATPPPASNTNDDDSDNQVSVVPSKAPETGGR